MYAAFVAEATARGRCLPQRRVRQTCPDGTELIAGLFGDGPDVRRAVIFYHGAGANMNVGYLELARDVADALPGTVVIVPDMRGHGRSAGARGHVNRRETLWEDVAVWRDFARNRYSGAQLFLGGHSAGAALCINHLREIADPPTGLILLAPYLGALPGRVGADTLTITGFSTRNARVLLRYIMTEGAEGGEDIAIRFNYPPDMARLNELVEGYTPEMALALTPRGAQEYLGSLTFPTLLAAAQDDALFSVDQLQQVCADAPALEFVVVEGDHLTCLYRAGEAIARWLARHPC